MSTYKPERWFSAKDTDELNEIISNGDVVPAIRAYLIMCRRLGLKLPYNAQYLLREAAHKIEELIDER